MLQFYIKQNNLKNGTGDYIAVSSNSKSVTIEDVYDYMTREGSTITKAEALSSYEEITKGMIVMARMGYSVISPLVNIKSRVRGKFAGEEDDYEQGRHKVQLHLNAGKRLAEAAKDIEPQKIPAQQRHPLPVQFRDNSSETANQIITPGRGACITGSLLKFDEEDENQGIFFIDTDEDVEIKVDAKMLKNKPKELIFLIPQLPTGTYRLEVRSILRGHAALRTGLLPDVLTVKG